MSEPKSAAPVLSTSTSELGTPNAPVRVAVIGTGPAGYYAAEALTKARPSGLEVDLIERLPTPGGLVRFGVAPDHQKIKNVTKVFDKIAKNPNVRLLANVEVGKTISAEELLHHYDQVIYCVGCETARSLGIEGEDLLGSHSATSFVAWYNGHPDFRDYQVTLDAEEAAVIGAGDVSMDITRMLVANPDVLAKTDIAPYALEVFRQSRVRQVHILIRRSPAQAAFAQKELRDISQLPGVSVRLDAHIVQSALQAGQELDTATRRKLEFLSELAAHTEAGNTAAKADRVVHLRFLRSPRRMLENAGRIEALEVEENDLVPDETGTPRARGNGHLETLPTGLVFRAVGYRGVPISGVPFEDRRGIIPNRDGRVLRDGEPWPRVYAAGWIKRGPSGVIGTNKTDASSTVQLMLEDQAAWQHSQAAPPREGKSRAAIDKLLESRGVRVVREDDWRRLDLLEQERGRRAGKVREKFTSVGEALEALDNPNPQEPNPQKPHEARSA